MSDDLLAQLYLSLAPAAWRGATAALETSIAERAVACVRAKGPFEPDDAQALATLAELCHRKDKPLLIAGNADEAIALSRGSGADGVHLHFEPDAVMRARTALGEDALVGIAVRDSRHDAMIAAEAGADYIAFSVPWTNDTEVPELLGWWAAMIETPMVVDTATTPSRLSALRHMAEFVTAHADTAEGAVQQVRDTLKSLKRR